MRKSNLVIIGLFLLLYILPLGVRPMIIPDETRYAEIPREMIASGDWVVPRLNGLRYFEKPAMGYWLNALSIKLFGETAFAVRFPSAMATGLSALMIFFLVRRFAAESSPPIPAVLIFITFFMVYGIGTFNILDSMLAMFVTASMTSFFFAHHAGPTTKKRKSFLLLFGIFCGLAFLTKGFLAFVIPVVAIVPFMIWEARFKELLVIPWPAMLAAVLVLMPWAIMIYLKEPDFWHFFIWNEHIKRFLSHGAQHHESFGYYVYLFPAAILPWTFLLPSMTIGLKKAGINRSVIRYAVCWFLFPFLFFSISKGKILTYLLPCFPPFAILMSIGLNKYFESGGNKAFNTGSKSLAIVMACIPIALIIIQIVGFKGFRPYAQTGTWMLLLFAFAVFSGLLLYAAKESDPKKKMIYFGCAPILVLMSIHFAIPDLTVEHKAPGAFLIQNADRIQPDSILVSDEIPMGAVCWYYKRDDVYLLEGGGEVSYGLDYKDSKNRSLNLEQFRNLIFQKGGERRIVLIAKTRKYEQWKQRLPKPLYKASNGSGGFILAQY